MIEDDNISYKIRPSARLIHTIGSDLIGDSYAALVELVKNSYDADATLVEIVFEYKKIENQPVLVIKVTDDGHGMDFNTIIHKWLVPATANKLKNKRSRNKKRVLQGRKGIGRFASAILGQEMTLSSIDEEGEKSTVVIDWSIFDKYEYLEDVNVLVEKEVSEENSGTTIEIIAKDTINDLKLSRWDKDSIKCLFRELRKLISPFAEFDKDAFAIKLVFKNSPFEDFDNQSFRIDTYPIIKLYDYRISGNIDENGNANLLYENNVNPAAPQVEKIARKFELENGGKYAGKIAVDFRVFDRDTEAIENLIDKGLIDPVRKKAIGKLDARKMLNEVYGVSIYKNLFRIRPYGDGGVDWLDLDKSRIQNPRKKVSNNQVAGFITIESEEESNLEEKSARDGLKENEYYQGLKEVATKAIHELEIKRFAYRQARLKGQRKKKGIGNKVSDLFSFADLTKSITDKLKQFNVPEDKIEQISNVLKAEEKSKAGLLEDIEKTIAIYQGQATLGKIVSYILHEGRKPLQFFNSESRIIGRYLKRYKRTEDISDLNNLEASVEGFKTNSKLLSNLFTRVNPLARSNRGHRKDFFVKRCIESSCAVFTEELKRNNIIINLTGDDSTMIWGWEEDLYVVMTNLLENSIYWLSTSNSGNKLIEITVVEKVSFVLISYNDNGPGLSDEEIKDDIIFEPGYSRKINGTGLGLAIAGEATERLNGELKALTSDEGACFQIKIKKIMQDEDI